jgi:hypothetical protein
VREVSDLSGEVRDSAVGLSMVGACDDLAMRSMTVLMVAVVIAEELGASRDMKADLGQACVELHGYDKEFVDSVEDGEKERAAAGVKAIKWLMGYRVWTQSLMRQGLCLASRHMKPDSEGFCASPLAQILRAAADYVDLTTPSPLVDSELFLSGGPLPPHRAMQRMKQEVGSRYSGAVMRGLVQGLGLLPVGTPVEMADGHGAVVVERTADPLCFIVADTLSRRRREANFKPGPNQIERLEKISQDLMDDEDE